MIAYLIDEDDSVGQHIRLVQEMSGEEDGPVPSLPKNDLAEKVAKILQKLN